MSIEINWRYFLYAFASFLPSMVPSNALASNLEVKLKSVDAIGDLPTPIKNNADFQVSVSGKFLIMNVATIGGCKDHIIELFLSREVLEKWPPISPGVIRYDMQGDDCKAALKLSARIDLTKFDHLAGIHDLSISTGSSSDVYLTVDPFSVKYQDNSEVDLKAGQPKMLGQSVRYLREAGIISGIDRDWINFKVGYGGGCEQHVFNAWTPQIPPSTDSRTIDVLIVHDDRGDKCKAIVERDLFIDIEGFRLPAGEHEFRIRSLGARSSVIKYQNK